MKKVIASAAIFLAGLYTASSQSTFTSSQKIILNLENALNIIISSAKGTNFVFTNINDYQNGMINKEASSFQITSNRPWALTVNSAEANFTEHNVLTPRMPALILGVRLAGKSGFDELSTRVATLTTGERGISKFNIDYNANPGFDYDAGTYIVSVVYTATQQ